MQRLDIGLAHGQPPQAPERSKTQKRVALVIGNSSYAKNPLAFVTNDAKDMAEALSDLGFDVSFHVDATRRDMLLAINAFVPQAKSADVALFYFAGHGEQVVANSDIAENFLLPVDVNPGLGETNISSSIAVVPEIINKLATSTENRIGIVILDACRSRAATRNDALDARLPSLFQGGLAKMTLPSGTFVAYAAAPGTYSFESPDSKHGRFTNSLLKHMRTPGLLLEQVFRRVRSDVERDSNMKQSPREESALEGNQDFYFVDPVMKGARKRGQVVDLAAMGSQGKALTTKPASGSRPETSDLIALIQRAPAVSRMRTLRSIVATRAPEFHVQEVEAILTSFWPTGRFAAFSTMADSLPRKMSLDDAGRVAAIALHIPFTFLQHQTKTVYEDLLHRGKLDPSIAFEDFERISREKDQQSGRCEKVHRLNTPSSANSTDISTGNRQLFQMIESKPEAKRRDLLQDVFRNQNVELNAAETVALLRLFPAESRQEILTKEIGESIPDLFTWDEAIETLQLIPVKPISRMEGGAIARLTSLSFLSSTGRLDATLTTDRRHTVFQLLREENSELWAAASAQSKGASAVPQNSAFAKAMSEQMDQAREATMHATYDPMLDPYKPCE